MFKFSDSWGSVVIYDLHIPLEHKNEATRRIIIRDVPRLRQHCGTVDELPFLNSHVNCDERQDNWQEVCRCSEDFCNTFAFLRSSIDVRPDPKDSVQFVKQDSQYPIEHRPQPEVVYRQHNSSLIVLLVIIPLSVGGFAVCLIFLNYHCKMC
ncbi:hypothetical protein B9Z55_013865 [Caenorhabditis nigoni]|uniref:Uncharacterized protein n=1 Tax=Caenorhabditis nigoni TaxID=1611254 RepID=A0A2G5U3K1_9PELO|nr:hypothetical protein B9Z55_013865 [Caenorhabditis nigoni]